MDEDHVVGTQRVGMDLDAVGAVFLGVGFAYGLGGELARLARQDEACTYPRGEGGAQHEAAGFHAYNLGDTLVLIKIGKDVQKLLQAVCVLEESGDVPEKNSLLGEVGDRAEM